ncbi:hypothetical protein chiPu_0028731, partial [Chiloscyllium punctatum]|nr:hypothetical protein [Chiloscyllium punctatum]
MGAAPRFAQGSHSPYSTRPANAQLPNPYSRWYRAGPA